MGDKVCVGLVGAGFAAHFHMEAYRRVYGVDLEVHAVTAAHQDTAVALADHYGIPSVYRNLSEMLTDPQINLVDLCVPNHLHGPYAIEAARAGKHVACEKPLTGYFGEPDMGEALVGNVVPREKMLTGALKNADSILQALRANGVKLLYAENWVYAPAIQKARRLLEASGGTILRIVGEESHSGSHASYYKQWRFSGGGSLIGKACHPLGAALYLKYCEGLRRQGRPIRARSVVAEVGYLTRIPFFLQEEKRWIKGGGGDIEDWGTMAIAFEDGSVAQITAADVVLGGIQNSLTVYASNAVVQCHINPNNACVAYAPDATIFGDEYISEKLETKAGWTFPAPDEDWITGYPQEFQDFAEAVACQGEPLSGALLARDVVAITYAAYLSAEQGRRVDLAPYLQ